MSDDLALAGVLSTISNVEHARHPRYEGLVEMAAMVLVLQPRSDLADSLFEKRCISVGIHHL